MDAGAAGPTTATFRRASLLRWAIVLALWTLLGLFFASETFFAFRLGNQPITWREALAYELPGWYVWALLAPFIALLAERVRFEPGKIVFALIFHASASALFSLIQLTLKISVTRLFQPGLPAGSFGDSLRFLLETGSHFNLLAYWGVLGASYALVYHRKNQERDLRASQMETRLAQARLQVLERELQPHFLFNTLNAVAALVHKDPDTAERMIARLGDLLRMTLQQTGQEVTLQEELELLDRYLDIEQTRFRDRLLVKMDVAPDTLRANVPRLLLQPIVENAIRHGVSARAGGGRVDIAVRRRASELIIRIADDGPGMPHSNCSRQGIGLANTRARLQQLYSNRHRFDLSEPAGGGVAVEIELPYRVGEASA